jgi:hypothetical protein
MTWSKKRIDVTISLGKGQFGNQPDSNSVTLTGYRVSMNMQAYFGDSMGYTECKIYGLPLDLMAQLTTIGPINTTIRNANYMSIAVGDVDSALTTIFTGVIFTAASDFQESPNTCLTIISYSVAGISATPVGAVSFKGSQSVETILGQIINNINSAIPSQVMTLVNNGVNVTLTDAYLPGDGIKQISEVAKSGRFSYRIDSTSSGGMQSNTLIITPTGQPTNDPVITISPDTSPRLIGYPTFSSQGVVIKCEFAPIQFAQKVIVAGSLLTQANNSWIAQNVVHHLESEKPGGAWMTTFVGVRGVDTIESN